MPYVDSNTRKELYIRNVRTPGELNYMMTMCILKYVEKYGMSYNTAFEVKKAMRRVENGGTRDGHELVEAIYAIKTTEDSELTHEEFQISAAMAYDEFRRRAVDPYEDSKILQNGDVYK